MPGSVFLRTVRDKRRSLLWWVLGVLLYGGLFVGFYGSLPDMQAYDELFGDEDSVMRALVGGVTDLNSPEGYLSAELLSISAPMLVIIYVVAFGSTTIASEERRGVLDMVLANPVTRRRVLLEKFGALCAGTLGVCLAVWVAVAAVGPLVGMDLSLARLAQAMVSLAFVGVAFGALALAASGATGQTGAGVAVAGVVAVASYLVETMAPLVDVLEPARYVSLLYYYDGAEALFGGISLGHAAVLVGVTAALVAVAALRFERRDLGV